MNFPSEPYNMANELAKERNRAAAERTLMVWIRTSLSLISFGFGIDRIIAAMRGAFEEILPIMPVYL
jgi:putative membrane protein